LIDFYRARGALQSFQVRKGIEDTELLTTVIKDFLAKRAAAAKAGQSDMATDGSAATAAGSGGSAASSSHSASSSSHAGSQYQAFTSYAGRQLHPLSHSHSASSSHRQAAMHSSNQKQK